MKLGFFVTNQYLPGESMPRKIQDSIEQVQAAREAGFGNCHIHGGPIF